MKSSTKYLEDSKIKFTSEAIAKEFKKVIELAQKDAYNKALDDALQERQQIGGMKFVDEVDIIKLKKK